MKSYEANEADGTDGRYQVIVRERDEYEPDSMYLALASVIVRGRSKHWPADGLRPYLYAELRGYKNDKRKHTSSCAGYWVVDAQCEQGDEQRTQWNAVQRFGTREEAAQFAADFMLHALSFWPRSCETGKLRPTPGMRRQLAAEEALDADERCQTLRREYAEAEVVADETSSGPTWHAAVAYERGAKDALDRYARTFIQDFHRAHDWREFTK